MEKLKLIIQREFLAKVKNKSFIIMTFLSPLLIIAMGVLITFLTKQNDSGVKEVVYVDNSGVFEIKDFKNTKHIKYLNFTSLGLEETKKKVEEGFHYGVLYVPKIDSIELLSRSIEFFSKETPGSFTMQRIERVVNKRLRSLKMKQIGIDEEKIKSSRIRSDIKLLNFSGEKTSKLASNAKIAIGSIAGYLLMMFVIIYGNSVMRSVIEEKTSRIIEVIVSSVKPFYLMLGKIIGNAAAGLLQFSIWGVLLLIGSVVVSLFIGMNASTLFAKNIDSQQLAQMQTVIGDNTAIFLELRKLPWFSLFFLFIFYFFGGYMLYSSLYAAIGAAVDNETDTQQFMMPIIMPLMLGVYVGGFSVLNDAHGPVAVFFSHFPLTSPIVMLMRYPFGVAWWEVLVSMFILIITFIGVVWLASKIYRVGILMYGKKPTFKDLWKWMRYNG